MAAVIYLVRHGIAGPAAAGLGNGDRRLSPEGKRKMRRVARGLKRLGVLPDVVLSSPLRRAEETASVVAGVLDPKLKVGIYPPLAPGHEPAEAVKGLRLCRAAREVMLIGHQPDLGLLASHLLAGTSALVPLPFKKGAVAAIRVASIPPRAGGTLMWFMTPKQLRAVGARRSKPPSRRSKPATSDD